MMRRALGGCAIAAGLVLGACGGPPIDVAKTLQPIDITTGWFDAGIVEGKNKLVPGVELRLKNSGPDIKGSVQLNAVFRRVGDEEDWGTALARAVDPSGLLAGATTGPVVLRSDLGYTGTDPRQQLLQNKLFVDARVRVFAKHGSAQWSKLGEYAIVRQLLPGK